MLARGGGWLTTDEARRLLAAAGIPSAPTSSAANADEAVAAAEHMGYPVALKAVGPALLHKTERNAVRLNLNDREAVRAVALGIAKPRPSFPPDCDRTNVLTPTTSPRMLTSGPPELPGLIGASVCT